VGEQRYGRFQIGKLTASLACTIAVMIMMLVFVKPEVHSMDLDQYKWKNRLLFIFAPDHNDPLLASLRKELSEQESEVADRDLIVFQILESDSSTMNAEPVDSQTTSWLREHFSIPQKTFALILVGKDGGIKMKRHDRVELADIFALIDAMPMRRQEMRQKGQRD